VLGVNVLWVAALGRGGTSIEIPDPGTPEPSLDFSEATNSQYIVGPQAIGVGVN
jgi:hypothetical protein